MWMVGHDPRRFLVQPAAIDLHTEAAHVDPDPLDPGTPQNQPNHLRTPRRRVLGASPSLLST
eukprot:6911337-Pyramimonas_sp.AAC.2